MRLWHRARDFDRGTHQPGRHGGAVGHTGLQVLHALVFDFLNIAPAGSIRPMRRSPARRTSACAPSPRRWRGCGSSGSSTGCAAAPRAGGTAASCWSRRPTPTPCCRRASGAATGRQQRRQRPRRARGENRRRCRMRSLWRALEAGLMVKVLALEAEPKDGLAAALASLGRAFMASNW